jgi:hypothetical protein
LREHFSADLHQSQQISILVLEHLQEETVQTVPRLGLAVRLTGLKPRCE